METEYNGKNFSIHWDVKEGILLLKTWGEHNGEIAKDLSIKIKEFCEEFIGSRPVKLFVDSSKSIKTDHEARRLYTKLTKEEDFLVGGVIAVYGLNFLIKMVTGFILVFAKKRKDVVVKFFDNKEEGLKWLKKYTIK